MKRVKRPKTPLAADPMELWIKEKHWNPAPRGELCALLKEFVDEKRLETSILRSEGEAVFAALRPLSLDRWLKSVEMPKSIQ